MQIRSWTDVPEDSATEPLSLGAPGALLALVEALGTSGKRAVAPLTDATCQSFPVWVYDTSTRDRIAGLDGEQLDAVASAWHERAAGSELDADVHELALLLADLQAALIESDADHDELFVLLEQKAF